MEGLYNIFKELQNDNSRNGKEAILEREKRNEIFKEILKFVYNPMLITGLSDKKFNKEVFSDGTWTSVHYSIINIMDYLRANNTGRDQDIEFVQHAISQYPAHIQELFKEIVTKNLKCGLSSKTINKVYGKGFIPEWEVQQGYPIDKYKFKKNEWICLGLKLNGIRATLHDDKFKSRQNKEMGGFDHIKNDIDTIEWLNDYVIDGELVRKNVDNVSDNENFRLTTSIVNSDLESKPEIEYVIFDIVPKIEFAKGESTLKFRDRLKQMKNLQNEIKALKLDNIRIFPIYYEGTDLSCIDRYLEEVDELGLEGLMALRNETYKCKRHKGILKVKSFKSADCKIIGYEEGTGKYKGMLGSFIIDFKGNSVNVGSGYTDEQRIEFWNNNRSYIGKILEVKYKEESKNSKNGLISLQFPTFVTIREDKIEPNYE